MCNTADEAKFQEVWKRTIWLAVEICKRYGFNPLDINQLNTHAWVSETWQETDHTDPDGYFQQHNKTWDNFVNDVKVLLVEGEVIKMLEQWQIDLGTKSVNELVQKGIIKNPEEQLNMLDQPILGWLYFTIINRIAK